MFEVWLRPNRRVLLLAAAPMAVLAALGVWCLKSEWLPLSSVIGLLLLGVAAFVLLELIRQILRPRLAYHDGHLLYYLRSGGPIAVPLSVVEAFFQGEGLAHLPGKSNEQTKTVNLVTRLSRREPDWHQREVKPALGNWSDGYVTIRGTWCEPITTEVIHRLNRRLREISQLQKGGQESI